MFNKVRYYGPAYIVGLVEAKLKTKVIHRSIVDHNLTFIRFPEQDSVPLDWIEYIPCPT